MSVDLKFEKEKDDSQLVNLDDMSAKVQSAIDDENKAAAPETPSASGSPSIGLSIFADAMLMAATTNPVVQAVSMAAIAISAASSSREQDKAPEINKTNSLFIKSAKAAPQQKNSSFFVQKPSAPAEQTPRAQGVSLMPMSLKEKKELLKINGGKAELIARSNISGMSLTGKSNTLADAHKPKGMKVTEKSAKGLKTAATRELMNTLDNLQAAKTGPMSAPRLEYGIGQGNANAERQVKQQIATPEAQKIVKKMDTQQKINFMRA